MNRAAAATGTGSPDAVIQTAEVEIGGVRAVCDPLGALYLPDSATLVVSDLHLEKGAAYARRGMLLPPYDTALTLKLLRPWRSTATGRPASSVSATVFTTAMAHPCCPRRSSACCAA